MFPGLHERSALDQKRTWSPVHIDASLDFQGIGTFHLNTIVKDHNKMIRKLALSDSGYSIFTWLVCKINA